MVNHCQDPRIAQQHFIHTARGRVAVVGGEHVGVQQAAQGRQGQGEILDQADGKGVDRAVILAALARGLGALLYRLAGSRRKVGLRNLELCFPDMPLAELLTLEQGKPLNGLGSRFEIGGAQAWAAHTASLSLPVEYVQDDDAAHIAIHRRPLGVVAAVVPWNSQLFLSAVKLGLQAP